MQDKKKKKPKKDPDKHDSGSLPLVLKIIELILKCIEALIRRYIG